MKSLLKAARVQSRILLFQVVFEFRNMNTVMLLFGGSLNKIVEWGIKVSVYVWVALNESWFKVGTDGLSTFNYLLCRRYGIFIIFCVDSTICIFLSPSSNLIHIK